MKISKVKDPPMHVQPDKCKGCIWGRWEAAAQFCSKPLDMCVKGSVPKVGDTK